MFRILAESFIFRIPHWVHPLDCGISSTREQISLKFGKSSRKVLWSRAMAMHQDLIYRNEQPRRARDPSLFEGRGGAAGGTAGRPPPLLHKLRTRVVRDPQTGAVLRSGLHLRPFCSTAFAPGVSRPTYDAASLAFVVRTANGTIAPTNLW